jgi:hypothetical protein
MKLLYVIRKHCKCDRLTRCCVQLRRKRIQETFIDSIRIKRLVVDVVTRTNTAARFLISRRDGKIVENTERLEMSRVGGGGGVASRLEGSNHKTVEGV